MNTGKLGSLRSTLLASSLGLASLALAIGTATAGDVGLAGGPRHLEAGQPVAMVHPTVEQAQRARASSKSSPTSGGSNNLSYHSYKSHYGGSGGFGVQTAPAIYVVFWGSQWNNNDPSGEATILESFYAALSGSGWSATDTQYCEGVASGTVFCNGRGTAAGNSPMYVSSWYDNATAAPTQPTQSQIAAEAVRAAGYFGNTSGSVNANAQYVIATATGNNSLGFTRYEYCAWHSSTGSIYGNLPYTYLPYITDAGQACGANFTDANGVSLGPDAGITIVAGHEMAESVTDPFPSTGWVDGSGSEIGDKCAWDPATANETLNGSVFPVQPLWSNAANSGQGGCVMSYP